MGTGRPLSDTALQLLAANADRTRTDVLLIERNLPFGMPKDRKERMSKRG